MRKLKPAFVVTVSAFWATEDLSARLCSVDGNPPPPDWEAPCPKAK